MANDSNQPENQPENQPDLQAMLEGVARICASNARAIAALTETVNSFVDRLDQHHTRIEIATEVADDAIAEAGDLTTSTRNLSASVTALREAAIEDRRVFREQAEADRVAFTSVMQEYRKEASANQEVMQRLLLELTKTNQRVSDLELRAS